MTPSGRRTDLPGHPIAPPRIDPRRTRFAQTLAFQKYGRQLDPDPRAAEDLYAKELLREQGFDGLPQVVSERVLNRFVQAGEPELFRGVARAEYAEQLRYGPLFVGRGIRGGGMYAAGGPDGLDHARNYAADPGGVILRMSLKADGRIADTEALAQERLQLQQRALDQLRRDRTSAIQLAWQRGASPAEVRAEVRSIEGWYDEREAGITAQFASVGIYAAYLGYAAVHDPITDVYLILNRTALRIQREDIR